MDEFLRKVIVLVLGLLLGLGIVIFTLILFKLVLGS